MTNRHAAFLDSIGWDGWKGRAGRQVAVEEELDAALDRLGRQVEEVLEEYQHRQSFTPPSRERREARQGTEYKLDQLPKKASSSP